jgi:hypothetical protein
MTTAGAKAAVVKVAQAGEAPMVTAYRIALSIKFAVTRPGNRAFSRAPSRFVKVQNEI